MDFEFARSGNNKLRSLKRQRETIKPKSLIHIGVTPAPLYGFVAKFFELSLEKTKV